VAYNSGEYDEAINNAYQSAVDYVKEEEPKHKEKIKDWVDMFLIGTGVYFIYEFIYLTTAIV
jgi:hypothetical protein